jgi:hypothetical protein
MVSPPPIEQNEWLTLNIIASPLGTYLLDIKGGSAGESHFLSSKATVAVSADEILQR